MKSVIIFLLVVAVSGVFIVFNNKKISESLIQNFDNQAKNNLSQSSEDPMQYEEEIFYPPLENANERVTKKPFGIFVTPQESPVSPEKFYGFHSAVDLEIFPGEENRDIQVRAICAGEILSKRSASGYGGVAVQSCELDEKPITVVYGHLNLKSINKNVSEKWEKGEVMRILGEGYSLETDGERKHLHLGIHSGSSINILGYVQNKELLNEWIDPCLYICKE
ncbi:MAG: hypothetical protein ACD_5C00253G0002 [uncultured bacterium]|nr:MAG: hypothetical protein ACD_5C00253G0002 [uncultured bacterium]